MGGLLLDTHALLWWMLDAPELPPGVRARVSDAETVIHVSAATVWEIAIKARKGRLHGVDDYLRHHRRWHATWGFSVVAIMPDDAVVAGTYAFAHADPFDRMLMAQAERLDAELATRDAAISAVSSRVYWE